MDPRELVQAAIAARNRAYAPYSNYRVGAALLGEDSRLFVGVNVENASYGLTICAERTAFVSAVAAGTTRFAGLAVVAGAAPASMCGACRQFAREFGADLPVHLASLDGTFRTTTVSELLPGSFGPDSLSAPPS